MSNSNQFKLLTQRRYLPFFITQFLGAFNDQFFKNALVIMISFSSVKIMGLDSNILINFAAVLFIIPFFLFSAIAGQLADKYDNATLMQYIKLTEIIIMSLAILGFYFDSIEILLLILFLTGTQSAFFGPVKYGYLPRVLNKNELIGGNGMTDMGTFMAILLGMIAGAQTITADNGPLYVSISVVILAILGFIASKKISHTENSDPTLKVNYNIFKETIKIIKYSRSNRSVFLSVIGISWFWFYGSTILTQIPNFTRHYISADESVFVLLVGAFSISVGIGSLLCEKLSGGRIELGLVPFGSLGLTIFALDFYFAAGQPIVSEQLLSISDFLAHASNWRILFDILMIGLSSGLYIVPLYALIQERTHKSHISRVIAANNIMNSLFMVVAGLTAMVLLGSGLSIPELILIAGIMNLVVALYIYKTVTEFLWRFVVWVALHTTYHVKTAKLDNIPMEGGAVIVCNHISYIDAIIIAGYTRRPVRFVMDHNIFKSFILGPIFRFAKAIPIAPAKENVDIMNSAFDSIASALDNGELVCIFPEGKITYDGELSTFKPGIEKIIERSSVPVIPMVIQGLWGSYFSRYKGKAMSGLPSFSIPKINLIAGESIPADKVTADYLYQIIKELRGDKK
jgi:1-acyl-sn-glycerol-3-phosphate acyltransferase